MKIIIMVIALMLPIFLGYIINLCNVFKEEETVTLRKFVVKVTVPFIIFRNMYTTDVKTLSQIFPTTTAFIITTVLFSITAYFALILFKKSSKQDKYSYVFSVFIGNYGYLGWGVMSYFFQDPGFTRSVFYNILFWPVFLGAGFMLSYFLGKDQALGKRQLLIIVFKKAAIPLIATALGIGYNILGLEIPETIWAFINKIGNMTIPLILFTIGLDFNFKMELKNLKLVIFASLHRLLFGFLIGIISYYITNLFFDVDNISAKVIILEAMMPTAVMATIFGEYVDLNKKLQSSIITFSTILSLLTIPLGYYLLGYLGFS